MINTYDDQTTYAKAVDLAVLDLAVRAGSFGTKIEGLISRSGGEEELCVCLIDGESLTASEKTELDGIISAHTP